MSSNTSGFHKREQETSRKQHFRYQQLGLSSRVQEPETSERQAQELQEVLPSVVRSVQTDGREHLAVAYQDGG